MRTFRALLLVLFALVFGLSRVLREVSDVQSVAPVIAFGALIVVWLPFSRMLIGFIDARNRSHRLVGFAGFAALLGAIWAVAWLSLVLKGEISSARDPSTSFLEDAAWLVVLSFLFYRITSGKEANQALQPTRMLGTSAAEPPRVPSTRVADL